MQIAQVNLIAVLGRGGFIGNAGERPTFREKDQAYKFMHLIMDLCEGGVIVLGARSYRMLLEGGYDPTIAKHTHFVFDRPVQAQNSIDEIVGSLKSLGMPIFVAGGRHTFECWMPYVEQFFISRANLMIGHDPIYMPDMFGRQQ